MDEGSRKELYRKLAKRHFERAFGWEKGEALVSFHETHPHAERKPSHEFLAALERTIPEVRTSLDQLRPLHAKAYTKLHGTPGVINELEDWGELEYAALNYSRNDETKCALSDLYAGVNKWAETWHVGASHWQHTPSWMLDQAVSYISTNTSANVNSFIYGHGRFKEHLSVAELKFVIQDDVKLYYLKDELEEEREAYIEAKKNEWEEKFRAHLAAMKRALDNKHGTPVKKKQRRHFDWLVLRHILGYSADTISTAYTRPGEQSLHTEPVRRAINDSAVLLGLKLRPLKLGRSDSKAKAEAVQDVARRLNLQ